MLGSLRTWWRIAAQINDEDRPATSHKDRRRSSTKPAAKPVLEAHRPGQIWSWDITDLNSPWRGIAYKAYSIIDIYSRKLIACRVEEREVDALAVDMFRAAFDEHGIPEGVHSDSGAAMRSRAMHDFLTNHSVTQTHNRPRVSNDNPFSESEFRTMKHRPEYPGTFNTLEEARDYITHYATWYNQSHKHSGIALFSPNEVHNGTWRQTWERRDDTLQAYYKRHPERFHKAPRTPAPASIVGINLPKEQKTTTH